MSYKLPQGAAPQAPASVGGSSSASDLDDDDNFSDWNSGLGEALVTQSLFSEEKYNTPEAAIRSDKEKHGVDVREIKAKLGLDVYGLMRLVNLIRKEKLSPEQVLAISKGDTRLEDDALLAPVIPDDPLLQLDFDEDWSDDEDIPAPDKQAGSKSDGRVAQLEAELKRVQAELVKAQSLLKGAFEEDEEDVPGPSKVVGKGKGKVPLGRDDDTHYFDSYAENDIHEIMLKDTTRTISYARYILSNPQIFSGAVVMDVGCGTGILSMFAARAGAKQVFAIEASGLASKARENIRRNGLDGVIQVIQGKVENITLPVKQVDVIISEWMGYMLLYESMLDSVLDARDRFLSPTGIMAPSQTRLVISGITGEGVSRSRIDFWKNVYGFDMTTMDNVYFDEGLVEYVDNKEIVTSEAIVRDIDTHIATPKSLDFQTDFELEVTADTTIRAFLTHFDTFFSINRNAVPPSQAVDIVRYGVHDYTKPVESSADGAAISFTTGPRGDETHWRQVVFVLRHGIHVRKGDSIQGKFFCRKSTTNSRELDVEIHYKTGEEAWRVQVSKVK